MPLVQHPLVVVPLCPFIVSLLYAHSILVCYHHYTYTGAWPIYNVCQLLTNTLAFKATHAMPISTNLIQWFEIFKFHLINFYKINIPLNWFWLMHTMKNIFMKYFMQIFYLEFWSLQKTRNKGPTTYSSFGDHVAHGARGEFCFITKNFRILI